MNDQTEAPCHATIPEPEVGSAHLHFSPSRTRLTLVGDIDAQSVHDLAGTVRQAIREGNPIDVDVGRVTFMDSSGLLLLATIAEKSPDLRIIQPPDNVRFLLEVANLTEHVEILPTDPESSETQQQTAN
jgi:anti-sigma B factor antagonist